MLKCLCARHFYDVTNVLMDSVIKLNTTADFILYHENSVGSQNGQQIVNTSEVEELGRGTCISVKT